VKPRKIIAQELDRLQQERLRYTDGTSLDSKYRYYTLSGKIDALKKLSAERKIQRDTVDALRQEIENRYREIRKIPKHKRDIYQTLQGVYLEAQLDIIQTWVFPVLLGG